ncbi:hypothetical protein SELMODRAFT_411642 [Selaginella moellendorffii]|uniref:Uncharacterized protein n=1 Tax=Selaginella moellendorffii TaxID=88036 RepID=D8RIK4_SELML|nr:hypothetical protein SELMODRAFT_411642 [Selaginella moellendorffii]
MAYGALRTESSRWLGGATQSSVPTTASSSSWHSIVSPSMRDLRVGSLCGYELDKCPFPSLELAATVKMQWHNHDWFKIFRAGGRGEGSCHHLVASNVGGLALLHHGPIVERRVSSPMDWDTQVFRSSRALSCCSGQISLKSALSRTVRMRGWWPD